MTAGKQDGGLTVGPGVYVTDDGGIIFSWERNDDDEISVVIPDDRSVVYFSARKRSKGERHAGVITKWSAVEKMLAWLEMDAPFPIEGVVEG